MATKTVPYESGWVLQIEWSKGYPSPFIGPFTTLTEAIKAKREIQANLRIAGRSWRGKVAMFMVVDLDRALYWAQQEEEADE